MTNMFQTALASAVLLLLTLGASLAQQTVESGHVTVKNPATLSGADANRIYDQIRQRMADNYALAELVEIKDYQSWTRYNSAPYVSATHGQRFVNNFANDKASAYGKLAKGEKYPVGAVFAKDAITVTSDNKIFPGAMFGMEKLVAGANPDTADWRYFVVLPDGTLFGDTTGAEPELVEYCHACHAAKASDDYVFFVPKAHRLTQ